MRDVWGILAMFAGLMLVTQGHQWYYSIPAAVLLYLGVWYASR